MKWFRPVIVGLLLASPTTSPLVSFQQPSVPGQPQGELGLNRREEREISGRAVHSWSVPISPGQYAELVVENKNIDVSIVVRRTDGGVYRAFDHQGYAGEQIVRWIASAEVSGRVEVQSIGLGALGRYGITLQVLRPATARDRSIVDADGLINAATAESGARRYEGAETLLRQALQDVETVSGPQSPETVSVLDSLADFYFRVGRFGESVALLDRSLGLKQKLFGEASPEAGVALNNLGVMFMRQGRFIESEQALRRALEIRGPGLGWDHPRVGITLDNLATALIELGRYAEAEASAARALRIFEQALRPNHYYVSFPLNILATIYQRQGQFSEAVPLLDRALAIDEAELGRTHENVAVTLARLGSILYQQGRYDEAESHYRSALAVNEKRYSPNHPNVASNLWAIARIVGRRGQHSEARTMFHQALDIERKMLGPRHPQVASTLIALGQSEFAAGTPSSAILPLVEEAIGILDQSVGSTQVRIEAFALRAQLHRRERLHPAAISDLAEAIRLVEELRPQVSGAEQARAAFFENYGRLFSRMVSWQVEAGKFDRAFEYAERRHARVLLDQLAAGHIDLRASIPRESRTDLERREASARARVAEFQQRITMTRSDAGLSDADRLARVKTLEASLQSADNEYKRVYIEMKNASPLWRDQVTSGGQPTPLSSVQRELVPPGGLLLLYQIGATESWLFVVPPGTEDVLAVPLTIDDRLAASLKTQPGPLTATVLNMLVSGPDSGVVPGLSSVRGLEGVSRADRATNLHALWRALIPGSVSTRVLSASEIVIVPDGPLHQLPFEALVIRPGSRADEVQYWLDEGPVVRYAPSATVLYNLTRRGGSPIMGPRGPAVLSVSDPLYDVSQVRQAGSSESAMFSLAMLAPRLRDSYERTGGALARLPGTARETAAIRAAYGTEAARSVQVLQGPQADEPRTRQALTGKRYLHLATHGLVAGHRDALFASLALTPPVGEVVDSTSDGFLQLHEIYDLRLGEVELAVLSACDTNRGPALDGEGVFALSRGFLAAGARRVVASQWSVGDDSTAELMGALFTRIVERERAGRVVDYAASLRDAKRVVRSRPQWRDPFHWAPFVLTGRR